MAEELRPRFWKDIFRVRVRRRKSFFLRLVSLTPFKVETQVNVPVLPPIENRCRPSCLSLLLAACPCAVVLVLVGVVTLVLVLVVLASGLLIVVVG